jgi:hypothetical protein
VTKLLQKTVYFSLIESKEKGEKYNSQKYFLFSKMDKNKCPKSKREFTFGKKEKLFFLQNRETIKFFSVSV